MKFVENHQANRLQRRILLQHACQYPLGHHLNACCRTHLPVEVHAVADGTTDPLTQRARHKTRRRTRRQPPRLQHEDFFTRKPRCIQQRQRYPRGLAGSGSRLQNRARMLLERTLQVW